MFPLDGLSLGAIGAELGLLLPELGNQLVVGSPHRLDLKQPVNLLKRHTARLGDEEEGEEEGAEGQRGKEEVDSVAHGLEHLLGEARDEKVEEPVAGRGGAAGQGAEVGVEELGVEDPGGAVPGGRVDGGPEVEEEDGGDAAAGQVILRVVGRVHHTNVGANDPHADGAANGTAEEELSAAELVDQEEEPEKGGDGLDDTKDTSHQVDSVGVDADTL